MRVRSTDLYMDIIGEDVPAPIFNGDISTTNWVIQACWNALLCGLVVQSVCSNFIIIAMGLGVYYRLNIVIKLLKKIIHNSNQILDFFLFHFIC